MQNNNKKDVLYAGFAVRLSAYVLDWIIIGALLLIVKIPKLIMYIENPESIIFKPILFSFSASDILIYLLGLGYFVAMTYLYGATLGKKVFNLSVIKSNQDKLTLIDVIYRESIGRYLSSILCLGYIIIMADSKKRSFHDMLCDTIVVYNFEKKKSKYENRQIEAIKNKLNESKDNLNDEPINKNDKLVLEKHTEEVKAEEVSLNEIIDEDNSVENINKIEDNLNDKKEN